MAPKKNESTPNGVGRECSRIQVERNAYFQTPLENSTSRSLPNTETQMICRADAIRFTSLTGRAGSGILCG